MVRLRWGLAVALLSHVASPRAFAQLAVRVLDVGPALRPITELCRSGETLEVIEPVCPRSSAICATNPWRWLTYQFARRTT